MKILIVTKLMGFLPEDALKTFLLLQSVAITRMEKCDFLEISVYTGKKNSTDIPVHVRNAVMNIPQLGEAFKQKILFVSDINLNSHDWFTTGAGKRRIIERKGW